METTSKKVTEENTQELFGGNGGGICVKNEQEIKFEPTSYHPFPSDDLELKPIVIKDQVGLVANLDKSQDNIVEINSGSQNHVPTVVLEKIPKTEAEILSYDHTDDEAPSSSDEGDDLYNIDTDSDSDSNSDPVIDPFADINCDPSFSQKPKSHNSHNFMDISDSSNLVSSRKSILLLVSAKNTWKQASSRKRQILSSKLQCGLCLEKQSSEGKLQVHVEICAASHQNRRRYCVPCNTLFSTSQKYRQHALKTHGIQVATSRKSSSFKCLFCPNVFDARESLAAHLTASHPEIKTTEKEHLHLKPYKCQDCSSTFSHYSALSSHIKSHKDEREFKCPMPNCEKAFKTNGNLKEHLRRIHSEDRPFKCTEPSCGKAFKMGDQLRKHMVCHSEERPFPCSLPDCGKTFKNKERLAKHLKAHAGARRNSHITDRPFKCQVCDRGFCKNWELTKHLQTHGPKKIKFFKCPEPNCETTFKYKGSIKAHIANIHTDKDVLPFQCPEPGCDQKFKYRKASNNSPGS